MNKRTLTLIILAATGTASEARATPTEVRATPTEVRATPTVTQWTVGSDCGGATTLQECVDYAYANNVKGTDAQINIPSGTGWAGAWISAPIPGAGGGPGRGYLTIKGAGSTITTVNETKNACGVFVITNGANVILRDMTITSSKACVSGIFAQNGAIVEIGPDFTFGAVTVQHMHAEAQSLIEVGQTGGSTGYHVKGGAMNHWACSTGGYIEIDPTYISVTFDKPVDFSQSFAWAQSGCQILVGGPHFSFVNKSNATSTYQYALRSNAVLDMNGGTNTLPGTTTSILTGGRCVNGDKDC